MTDPKGKSPQKRPQRRRKTGDSLVVLDNPDDGEIFTSGDAADVAGENRVRNKEKKGEKEEP